MIARLRKQDGQYRESRARLRELYARLDELQFIPDYLCVVIDKETDYRKACKGITINGIKYARLLGTNGGIKNRTIVFVSDRLAPFLRQKTQNGRDMEKLHVPAKLEAYQALVCSGSSPVSLPRGVLVVPDCETMFPSDIIRLSDEAPGEPVMESIIGAEIHLTESDGYGLMLPSLAQRWSEELGLGYCVSGVNTRFAFEKGMAFTFDFLAFAEGVAGRYKVVDAWGDTVDIRSVELILTTSMVKLWDSYRSCEHYLTESLGNGYSFSVTKTCVEQLESERQLNYQFIQSYELDDDQLDELISPTREEIHEVLGGDWAKTILFLKGRHLDEGAIRNCPDDFSRALMVSPELMGDSYVAGRVHQMIRGRINEAKVGVLNVHGNYSVVCGDPYALCQSIFDLPVTGLLKAGEIYNRYWVDRGVDEVVCFRAPMTCHNNIRLVQVANRAEMQDWYRHLTACTLFNAWDTAAHALNGMDKDGDLVLLTDNEILRSATKELPAILCMQRKATAKQCDEEAFVAANIGSFGDDIGKTTNYITSMFAVRARFAPGSAEYRTLTYRIMCGQLYQQNAIDKAKGILCKPMPKYWVDRAALARNAEPPSHTPASLLPSLVADKKPYFIRYIYPALMRQYREYVKNANKKALRLFRQDLAELYGKEEKRSHEEREFLLAFERYLPVENGPCIMNRICRMFEHAFDGSLMKHNAGAFDYEILKSGVSYGRRLYGKIEALFAEYQKLLADHQRLSKRERMEPEETRSRRELMVEAFQRECRVLCQDEAVLCDIVLDICYQRAGTKQFAWDMCSAQIVKNLLDKNGGRLQAPVPDPDGGIVYRGERFRVITVTEEGTHTQYHTQ